MEDGTTDCDTLDGTSAAATGGMGDRDEEEEEEEECFGKDFDDEKVAKSGKEGDRLMLLELDDSDDVEVGSRIDDDEDEEEEEEVLVTVTCDDPIGVVFGI